MIVPAHRPDKIGQPTRSGQGPFGIADRKRRHRRLSRAGVVGPTQTLATYPGFERQLGYARIAVDEAGTATYLFRRYSPRRTPLLIRRRFANGDMGPIRELYQLP